MQVPKAEIVQRLEDMACELRDLINIHRHETAFEVDSHQMARWSARLNDLRNNVEDLP